MVQVYNEMKRSNT